MSDPAALPETEPRPLDLPPETDEQRYHRHLAQSRRAQLLAMELLEDAAAEARAAKRDPAPAAPLPKRASAPPPERPEECNRERAPQPAPARFRLPRRLSPRAEFAPVARTLRALMEFEHRIAAQRPGAKPSAIVKPDPRRDLLRDFLFPLANKQPTPTARNEFRLNIQNSVEDEVRDPDISAGMILVNICQKHRIGLDPNKVPDSLLVSREEIALWERLKEKRARAAAADTS